MSTPLRLCANCGDPCPPGLRWCSNTCFYQEDGYPDAPADDAVDDEESDMEHVCREPFSCDRDECWPA